MQYDELVKIIYDLSRYIDGVEIATRYRGPDRPDIEGIIRKIQKEKGEL